MNNYEICAQWVLDQRRSKDFRVLDYGCGAGQIVKELRKRNVDAFGCDVFYEGGDYSTLVGNSLFAGGIIRRMDGDTVPFDACTFDIIVNSQVMEHVPDLGKVLSELHRVLKPGGMVLSLFPDKSVWREGHCGVPFLHWFPKGSRSRVLYAAALRSLGFGHFKDDKTIMQWSRDFCEWLDKWTYYRDRREIKSTYERFFFDIQHIEEYWIQLRLGGRSPLIAWMPVSAQKFIVNKLGGLVFVAHKPIVTA